MPSKIALSISALAIAIGMVNAAPHFEYKSYNGGHNVVSNNENKLIDLSELGLDVDLLKRTNYAVCKKYVSSYNGGHNVYIANENKLVDLSDATVDISLLTTDGRKQKTWRKVPRHCLEYIKSYNGGHNVVVSNENKLVDLSNLGLGLDLLKRHSSDVEYYNAGHNVELDKENKLVDASDLLVDVDILRRKAPTFSSYNGGHNVELTNENKLLDLSGLLANVDILKKRTNADYSYYNGGHNVESTNENKLIDLSDFFASIDILKKRTNTEYSYYNGGHNVESTNENKLIDLSDLTALVNVLSKRSLKGYGSKIHARDISETLYRRTNNDEDCTCVKKPKPTPPKQNPTQPPRGNNGGSNGGNNGGNNGGSNGGNNGGNGDSCSADKPAPPTGNKPTPPPTTDNKPTPPTDNKPTPPTDNKPTPPAKVTCGTNEVYINEGHNVVSRNENKLLDLSDITINIDILGDLFGGEKKKQQSVPANSVCTAKSGCCVAKSVYYYNGGHNVESTNENKGLDLSGLNLGLNIL